MNKFSTFLILMMMSCGEQSSDSQTPVGDNQDSSDTTSNTGGSTTDSVPTKEQITALIASGDYLTWSAEPAVHASTGPHGQVRTFINDVLKTSQDNGNSTHTVGSIAVKELYASDGVTLKGYAWEQKITSESGKDSWLWYEDLNKETSSVDFYGVGITLCTGCHASGTDYVLTTL